MKKNFLLLVLGIISYSLVMAQECAVDSQVASGKSVSCSRPAYKDFSAVLATWRGSYIKGNTEYEVFLDVKRKDGKLYSFISVPQLGIKKQEYKAIACCESEIKFKPAEGNEIFYLTVSNVNNGILKGRVHEGEQNFNKTYALAMYVNRN